MKLSQSNKVALLVRFNLNTSGTRTAKLAQSYIPVFLVYPYSKEFTGKVDGPLLNLEYIKVRVNIRRILVIQGSVG